MTDHPKITDRIMQAVGGIDNIKSLSHCATRLRFVLIDKTKFNTQQLEQIPEVLSAVSSGDESQVVVGAKVTQYYAEIMKNYAIRENNTTSDATASSEKNVLKRVLNAIVNIMAPIITVLIAGGLFKVVIAIMALCGLDPKRTPRFIFSPSC